MLNSPVRELITQNAPVFKDSKQLEVNVTQIQARKSEQQKESELDKIYFIIKGKGTMIISGERDLCIKIKKGSTVIVPAKCYVNIISKSNKDLQFIVVNSKGVKNGKSKR